MNAQRRAVTGRESTWKTCIIDRIHLAGGCGRRHRSASCVPLSISHERCVMATPFDTRQFVKECRDAVSANDPVTATRAVVREAVRALASGIVALPPLDSMYARHSGRLLLGHDWTLFEDEAATVTVVETEPGHFQPPHDHAMCAVIGVFEGGERNRFYRRAGGRATLATRRVVRPAEVIALRERTVHAISAEAGERCRALHVYLGPLSSRPRSLFHPRAESRSPSTSTPICTTCARPERPRRARRHAPDSRPGGPRAVWPRCASPAVDVPSCTASGGRRGASEVRGRNRIMGARDACPHDAPSADRSSSQRAASSA